MLIVNISAVDGFHSYCLVGFSAFDEDGFVTSAVDGNLEVLKVRELKERRYCSEVKGAIPI